MAIKRIREKFGKKIIKLDQKNEKRIYIDIKPENIGEFTKFLFDDLNLRFIIASGIDTSEGIEILYHFSEDSTGRIVSLRVLIENKESPEIESITQVVKGAEWMEREIWELLGVNFKNHPNLKRLLLDDSWPEGRYPLRKNTSSE